jgi:hypothetical protein
LAVGVAATPAAAALDLLQRLEEKGIITAEERQELAKQEDTTTRHGDKSLTWTTDDGRFSTQLYGYGQIRYTFDEKDDGAGDNRSNFSVRRARVGLRGYAFTPQLKYQLYLNIYSGNEADVSLFDWFVDYVPMKQFGVKVGQYKIPYASQWNISATSLQFVERTTVDANFRFDRDTGLTLHGNIVPMLAYDAGVYNGEGKNRNNSDTNHLWVGRLRLEPLGKYPWQESDLGLSEEFRLALAAGAAFDDDVAKHTRKNLNDRLAALGQSDVTSYNAFLGAKFRGASLQWEYHTRTIDPEDSAQQEETARGFYVQGGYLVWRNLAEVAARYEWFDPDDDRSDDEREEYGLGCNWFFAGNRNKLQADLFRIRREQTSGDTRDDTRFRVQYQLAF